MSDIITRASREWASRPSDERFCSLNEMEAELMERRHRSASHVIQSKQLELVSPDGQGLYVQGKQGLYRPTHWAFGQLAAQAGAPAHYLRDLPGGLSADLLNYGMRYAKPSTQVQILTQRGEEGPGEFQATTGPNYGRVWNSDIVRALRQRFGSGVPGEGGDWTVPGEFGKALREVTKANTTLYASDRDMFVFLADETNRIEVPSRRNGQPGLMSRGFFVWNSQVGSRSLGVATFLFDYVCQNRIVWGAQEYKQITIRHSAMAPERFAQELLPALRSMHEASDKPILAAIEQARSVKIPDLADWLRRRKQPEGLAKRMDERHLEEEGRPVETIWDATTAITALARDVPNQDTRVEMETLAGRWMSDPRPTSAGLVPAAAFTADDLGF